MSAAMLAYRSDVKPAFGLPIPNMARFASFLFVTFLGFVSSSYVLLVPIYVRCVLEAFVRGLYIPLRSFKLSTRGWYTLSFLFILSGFPAQSCLTVSILFYLSYVSFFSGSKKVRSFARNLSQISAVAEASLKNPCGDVAEMMACNPDGSSITKPPADKIRDMFMSFSNGAFQSVSLTEWLEVTSSLTTILTVGAMKIRASRKKTPAVLQMAMLVSASGAIYRIYSILWKKDVIRDSVRKLFFAPFRAVKVLYNKLFSPSQASPSTPPTLSARGYDDQDGAGPSGTQTTPSAPPLPTEDAIGSLFDASEAGNDMKSRIKLGTFLLAVLGAVTGIDVVSKTLTAAARASVDSEKLLKSTDDLVYYLFGEDLFSSREYEKMIARYEDQALKFMTLDSTKIDRAALRQIKDFIIQMQDVLRQKNSNSDVNLSLLQTRVNSLSEKMQLRTAACNYAKVRPATTGVYFYGKPGRGKTEYVTKALIPQLAKAFGISSDFYSFANSKYSMPVTNERFAVWDEFGATVKDSDNSPGPLLNAIMSSAPANIQGAALENKLQTANFTSLFLCSNVPPEDVCLGLKQEAMKAFVSRLTVIQVQDPQYDPKSSRTNQTHRKPDFSHLEFWVRDLDTKNFQKKSCADVFDLVANGIVDAQEQFENLQKASHLGASNVTTWKTKSGKDFKLWAPDEVAEAATNVQVQYIYGAPGVGKTLALKNFIEQAGSYILPVQWMTRANISAIDPSSPKIYVFDDYFTSHTDPQQMDEFLQFYNSLPVASKVIVISNLPPLCVCTRRCQLSTWYSAPKGYSNHGYQRRMFDNVVYIDNNEIRKCNGTVVKSSVFWPSICLGEERVVWGSPQAVLPAYDIDIRVAHPTDIVNGLLTSRGNTYRGVSFLAAHSAQFISMRNVTPTGALHALQNLMKNDVKVTLRIVTSQGTIYIQGGVCYLNVNSVYASIKETVDPVTLVRTYTVTYNEPSLDYTVTRQHLLSWLAKEQPSNLHQLQFNISADMLPEDVRERMCSWHGVKPDRHVARTAIVALTVFTLLVGIGFGIYKGLNSRDTPIIDHSEQDCGCVPGGSVNCFETNCDVTDMFVAEGVNRHGGKGKKNAHSYSGKTPGLKSFYHGGEKFYEDELEAGTKVAIDYHNLHFALRNRKFTTRSDGEFEVYFKGRYAYTENGFWYIEDSDRSEVIHLNSNPVVVNSVEKHLAEKNTVSLLHDGTFLSYGFMISSNMGICPCHVAAAGANVAEFSENGHARMAKLTVVRSYIEKEIAIFVIDREGPFKDMTDRLLPLSDLSQLSSGTLFVFDGKSMAGTEMDMRVCHTLANVDRLTLDSLAKWGLNAGLLTYVSSKPTRDGSCGSPIFAKIGNREILVGIHAAARITTSTLYCALACREIFEGSESFEQSDFLPTFSDVIQYGTPPHAESFCPHGPGLERVGSCNRAGSMYGKMTKYPMNFSDELVPKMKFPVPDKTQTLKLYGDKIPTDLRGVKHIHYPRSSKANSNVFCPSKLEKFTKRAAELGAYCSRQFQTDKIEILTPSAAITGTRTLERMPLDGSTGAVFRMKFPKAAVKGDIFDKDLCFKNDECRLLVNEQMNLWRKGNPAMVPVTASMKKELLPEEKHWRQRVFHVVDPITVLNQRRVLAPVQSILVRDYKSPFQLVTSPFRDWHHIRNDLLRISNSIMCLDAKAFDWTVPAHVLMSIPHFCYEFYKFEREEKQSISYLTTLRSLFHSVAFSPIVFEKDVISRQGGVPSGMFGTSLTDSVSHLIILYSAYVDMFGGTVDDFFSCINPKTCGDDMIFSIHPSLKTFDFAYLKKYYGEQGILLTGAGKTEDDQPLVSISEASFCSKSWVPMENFPNFYIPKLGMLSLSGAAHWSNTFNTGVKAEQLYNIQMELLSYGRKTFDQFQVMRKKWCLEKRVDFVSFDFSQLEAAVQELILMSDAPVQMQYNAELVDTTKLSKIDLNLLIPVDQRPAFYSKKMKVSTAMSSEYDHLVDSKKPYWDDTVVEPTLSESGYSCEMISYKASGNESTYVFRGFPLNYPAMWLMVASIVRGGPNLDYAKKMWKDKVGDISNVWLTMAFSPGKNKQQRAYNKALYAHQALGKVVVRDETCDDWVPIYQFFLNHSSEMLLEQAEMLNTSPTNLDSSAFLNYPAFRAMAHYLPFSIERFAYSTLTPFPSEYPDSTICVVCGLVQAKWEVNDFPTSDHLPCAQGSGNVLRFVRSLNGADRSTLFTLCRNLSRWNVDLSEMAGPSETSGPKLGSVATGGNVSSVVGAPASVLVDGDGAGAIPAAGQPPAVLDSSKSAPMAMMSNIGGIPNETSMLTGSTGSILTKAYERNLVSIVPLPTTTTSGTVLSHINFDPWSSDVVGATALAYANLHRVFSGSINFYFRVVTSGMFYGNIAVVFVPAIQHDITPTIYNYRNFLHMVLDLSVPSDEAFNVRPTITDDNHLIIRKTQSQNTYGKIYILSINEIANAYGTEGKVYLNISTQLAEDARYSTIDYTTVSPSDGLPPLSSGSIFPEFPSKAYATLATDGKEAMRALQFSNDIVADTIRTSPAPTLGGPVEMLMTWICRKLSSVLLLGSVMILQRQLPLMLLTPPTSGKQAISVACLMTSLRILVLIRLLVQALLALTSVSETLTAEKSPSLGA
jgi:hypothetical protein